MTSWTVVVSIQMGTMRIACLVAGVMAVGRFMLFEDRNRRAEAIGSQAGAGDVTG